MREIAALNELFNDIVQGSVSKMSIRRRPARQVADDAASMARE
jgi:hypothetical protein